MRILVHFKDNPIYTGILIHHDSRIMRCGNLLSSSVFLLALGIIAAPMPARADCTAPSAPTGTIEYFSASPDKVHRFCDGAEWITWAGRPVDGLSPPAFALPVARSR